tara:strand:- start:522 stop:1130 length:609 start_codon:yes stop_codon:yes gene_type:complete
MANRNTTGFGLISAGTIGSTPSTQGQGKYYVEAAYAQDLFQGCSVRMKDGFIEEAQSTTTFATIGVFNGIFYNASTTLKPTWANWYNQPITPANSENITCFVLDNPFQLFVGSASGAVTQANMGRTVSFGAAVPTGRENSGQCLDDIDVGTINDTLRQWRIVRSAEDPENSDITNNFCSFVFAQNLGQYTLNIATAGNSWNI